MAVPQVPRLANRPQTDLVPETNRAGVDRMPVDQPDFVVASPFLDAITPTTPTNRFTGPHQSGLPARENQAWGIVGSNTTG